MNQLRNPLDVFLKTFQSIFTALVVLIVFGRINSTNKEPSLDGSLFQNLRGVMFFLVSFNAFGGVQGTLATFSG